MKILFISCANSIHTVRWVNQLTSKGHEVNLVFCRDHGPTVYEIDSRVNLISLPFDSGKGYYLNALHLNRIAKNIKADVINVHYASGYATLARMARLKNIVLSVWGSDVYDFPYESDFKMKIIKKNINYAKVICSTSYAMANQVRKVMNNENMQIEVTPFGVDINRYKVKKIENDSDSEIKIGIVKTISEKYGIKYLIEAMEILKDKLSSFNNIDFTLSIYGDGYQKPQMIELRDKLGLKEIIEFKGVVPNDKVPSILLDFDIFALSSILDSESFGVAAVEAMAAGLPVVATDVDGFKEVVKDNETGIIVERKSPEALANAILELILDKNKRKLMGLNGRKRVEELYNFSDNVDHMIEIYNKINKSMMSV